MNTPEALAAAREILEAAQTIPYQGTKHFIETRSAIIAKHFSTQQQEIERLNKERDQLSARLAEMEKALKWMEAKELERKAKALDWLCAPDPDYSISQLSNNKWICYHYKDDPIKVPQFDSPILAIENAMKETTK